MKNADNIGILAEKSEDVERILNETKRIPNFHYCVTFNKVIKLMAPPFYKGN